MSDNLIDFAVSDDWARHYGRRGLIPPHMVPAEDTTPPWWSVTQTDNEDDIAALRREIRALRRDMHALFAQRPSAPVTEPRPALPPPAPKATPPIRGMDV